MSNKLRKFLSSKSLKILVFIVIAGLAIFLVRARNSESKETYVASEHTIERVVLLSGSVRAVGQVNLSFGTAGKVATTAVSQGETVTKGQVLAELDYEILKADLLQAKGKVQSAESSVSLARASVQKAEANLAFVQAQNRGTDSSIAGAETALANTINEQATLVKNAHSDLLNNDLVAYPVDNHRNITAPVVLGNYTGEASGEYNLSFYSSGGETGYSAQVSGLSKAIVSFDDFGVPGPLSTQGLYLTLPTSAKGESYGNTDWVIPIPNTRSTTYQAKLGAYNKALQTESLTVSKAQSDLDTLIARQGGGEEVAITTAQEQQAKASLEEAKAGLEQALGSLTQARAGVARVEAQIENNIIRAPFDGAIARFDFKIGQSVGLGQTGVTIITDGDYELVMSIPEIDIAKVKVGDAAEVILDAYGTGVVWKGRVTEIESVETEIDGVPSYSSIITITNPDERIRVGMNARARIEIDKKEGVIAIPSSYVKTVNNQSTVLVKRNGGRTEERVVNTGLIGTDYFVEVTSGLAKGEILVSRASK